MHYIRLVSIRWRLWFCQRLHLRVKNVLRASSDAHSRPHFLDQYSNWGTKRGAYLWANTKCRLVPMSFAVLKKTSVISIENWINHALSGHSTVLPCASTKRLLIKRRNMGFFIGWLAFDIYPFILNFKVSSLVSTGSTALKYMVEF